MGTVELTKTNLEGWQIGRDDLVMFKEDLSAKRERFDAENNELIEKIGELSLELDEEKTQFKEQAIELFKQDGNKKLLCGLGIREGIRIVYEETDALEWAKEHDLALALDKKRFEQLAKTEDIIFVEKEKTLTVTFPKKIVVEEQA